MSEPFIGEIRCFGFNFAPQGWARCDGQLLSIAQNTALFSLLGTMYGGDGEVTFGLPDLRGRVAVHTGSGPGLPPVSMGQKAGNPTTTLSVSNLPSHSHSASLQAAVENADGTDPAGNWLATTREDTYIAPPQDGTHTFVDLNASSVSVSDTGSGTSFNNMPPYQVVNWCIALVGTYPSS